MDKAQIERYIEEKYGVSREHPWVKYPNYTVYRHAGTQKWFALIMDVPREKFGIGGAEKIDVLDVKCDPNMIGSLLQEDGFYPAYHMSKEHWITVALDGSVSSERIEWLLGMSYDATKPR